MSNQPAAAAAAAAAPVKLDYAGKKRKRHEQDKAAGLTRRQCESCGGEGRLTYDNADDDCDEDHRGEPCDECYGRGSIRQRACINCGTNFDVEEFSEQHYYGSDEEEEKEKEKKEHDAAAAKMMARELCGDCERAKKKAAASEKAAAKKHVAKKKKKT